MTGGVSARDGVDFDRDPVDTGTLGETAGSCVAVRGHCRSSSSGAIS